MTDDDDGDRRRRPSPSRSPSADGRRYDTADTVETVAVPADGYDAQQPTDAAPSYRSSDSHDGAYGSAAGTTGAGGGGGGSSSHEEPSDSSKVFVGGISWNTTEETLISYFGQYGRVLEANILRDKTGQHRGFGFVKFADAQTAQSVMQMDHTIDGRSVKVSRAVPRSEKQAAGATGTSAAPVMSTQSGPIEAKKIFVGGLAPSVDDNGFRNYFQQFGNVTEAIVMMDRKTNRSRGFGFITFEHESTVDIVMARNHSIDDKRVELKRATPRDAKPPQGTGYPAAGASGGRGRDDGRGGAYMGQTGHEYAMDPSMFGWFDPAAYAQYMAAAAAAAGAAGAGGTGSEQYPYPPYPYYPGYEGYFGGAAYDYYGGYGDPSASRSRRSGRRSRSRSGSRSRSPARRRSRSPAAAAAGASASSAAGAPSATGAPAAAVVDDRRDRDRDRDRDRERERERDRDRDRDYRDRDRYDRDRDREYRDRDRYDRDRRDRDREYRDRDRPRRD